MWQLFKTDHYLMLKDDVYTHNFEINCGTDQVQQLFEVQRLHNQVNTYSISEFFFQYIHSSWYMHVCNLSVNTY